MVRLRHDDPALRPYWPNTIRLGAAMSLATDVEGLRLVLATTIADRYEIQVPDDGSEVRRRGKAQPPTVASAARQRGAGRGPGLAPGRAPSCDREPTTRRWRPGPCDAP